MKTIGKKLSNQEMSRIKGGSYTCQCSHNSNNIFDCIDIVNCFEMSMEECPNEEWTDVRCKHIQQTL